MSTATAIMTLSPLANEVDCAARYYVDRIDRDHYDGRMSSEKARDFYRLSVCSTVHKRMMEELEPIRKAVSSTMCMLLRPAQEIPKELRDMMESVEKKWAAVVEELCGAADKTHTQHKFKGLEADAMWMDEADEAPKQPVAQKKSTVHNPATGSARFVPRY